MRTRSGSTYTILLPLKEPKHELMQLLGSDLDPSRNTVVISRGACNNCTQLIHHCIAGVTATGRCHTVDQQAFPQLNVRLSHIEGSFTLNCHVCILLRHRLQELMPPRADHALCSIKITRWYDTHSAGRGILIGTIDLVRTSPAYPLCLLEARWSSQGEKGHELILRPTATSLTYASTANDKCFDLSRSWLHKCVKSHNSCAERHSHSQFTPTRLLKIEVNERADIRGYSVRLCEGMGETKSNKDVPTYVALSHRWGTATPYVLNSQSHALLRNGIPISDLPPTFKDAVIVTAMLGYSWIWIDCLCILQDSFKDWEAQAQLMGSVYRHCHLNLAALDASDCHAGLFSRRDHRSLTPYAIQTSAGDLVCISHLDVYQAGPERGGLYEPRPGLLSRGWVVQEVLLSRRTLYYCKDMLFWECCSRIACERWPKLSNRFWICKSQMGKRWLDELLSNKRASGGVDYYRWGMLIQRYSETTFTYWKDRYYAFLGLAQLVQDSSGQALTVGLWKSNLLQELTWRSTMPSRFVRQTWLPSWSWMSHSTAVDSPYGCGPIRMIHCYADVEGTPADGFRPRDHLRTRSASDHITLRASVTRLLSWQRPNSTNVTSADCSWGKVTFAMDLYICDTVTDTRNLYVMALFQGEIDGSRNDKFYGLIIKPSVNREGFWERVGCSQGDSRSAINVSAVQATKARIIKLI
jgi:hypothetical protein